MLQKRWRVLLAICLFLPALLALPGCEDEPSSTDVENYLSDDPFTDPERDELPPADPRTLTINPTTAVVTNDNETLMLTAAGGHKPYEWRVDDASVGDVHGSTDSAVYTRYRSGNNLVRLSDSRGQWTYCSIAQPGPGETAIAPLAISPTAATVTTNGGMYVFSAAGGVPPYTWDVNDGTKGQIISVPATDPLRSQALYRRNAAGDSSVVLRDSVGTERFAIVTQP